ncbi:uncharacterized protein LOC134219222 isoform X4 [Armigeres subalbatus]|uniref:uncharacterized protein LOC134219222 isoform X4 n=1 Tax=Armigeres subalbatus TaxID=124917 RepID=UPI002ECFC829
MSSKFINVIAGEASESDDDGEEICGKVVQISDGTDAPPLISIDTNNTLKYQRLITYGEEAFDEDTISNGCFERRLHQKINDRCVSLLNEFIHMTAVSVSKQLVETDNLLMKSQVKLQVLMNSRKNHQDLIVLLDFVIF